MAAPSKPLHPLASVGGIAGAVGGYALSHYAGPALWIPGIATILLMVLFTKTAFRPKRFAGAIATTGGHVIWFIAACAIINYWAAAALDIAILTGGIVWLWIQPGLGAVLFLGLVQLASLGFNVWMIFSAPFGSPAHKALTVHCIWRLIAIACLVTGYLAMRRERSVVVANGVQP